MVWRDQGGLPGRWAKCCAAPVDSEDLMRYPSEVQSALDPFFIAMHQVRYYCVRTAASQQLVFAFRDHTFTAELTPANVGMMLGKPSTHISGSMDPFC